jgi:hypothetical protein
VNPRRVFATPTTANTTLIVTTCPQPYKPSNMAASRVKANAIQPAATPIRVSETITEPIRPRIDRVRSAWV